VVELRGLEVAAKRLPLRPDGRAHVDRGGAASRAGIALDG